MSITLTVTYREVLAPETLSLVDKLVDDNYDLGCMLEFIDENSELDFREYYPLYVELGEIHGFETAKHLLNQEVDRVGGFYFRNRY